MPRKGPNIYKRKDHRWEGRLYNRETGKYRSVYGKTYSETRDKLQVLRQQQKPVTRTCRFSFEEVVLQWLENVRIRVKSSTYANYFSKVQLHIIPYFHGIRYDAVTPTLIDQFVQDKLANGFSTKYVSDIVSILKSAAKWAEKEQHYLNRISEVKVPKSRQPDPMLLNTANQKKLLLYLRKHEDLTALGIYLAMFSGLRIGEICALQWQDFDQEENILHITKTIQRYTNHDHNVKRKTVVRITSPKTENAVREIPLPDFLLAKMCVFRSESDDFILTGTKHPMEPRCMTFRFQAILKKAGVPSVKFHSLRHTFATNCLQQNFDIKTLSEILGHSKMETTMRIYLHSSLERKRACMAMVELGI